VQRESREDSSPIRTAGLPAMPYLWGADGQAIQLRFS
jgi:hypothetical protein